MKTRQAASIKTIRAARRARGECADCGSPSEKYRCDHCRPPKGHHGGPRRGAGRPPSKLGVEC